MSEVQKVWVLRIEHNEGMDITVHADRQSALRTAADYVTEWWHELDRHNATSLPEPMPDDLDERVERYFDLRDDEWHAFWEETIRRTPAPVIQEEPEFTDLA